MATSPEKIPIISGFLTMPRMIFLTLTRSPESLPSAEREALLYGNWDSFSGQYFSEWKNDPEHYLDRRWTHVIEPFEIPEHWRIYRSYDFGSARPFSCGWWTIDPDGVLYRILEYYGWKVHREPNA